MVTHPVGTSRTRVRPTPRFPTAPRWTSSSTKCAREDKSGEADTSWAATRRSWTRAPCSAFLSRNLSPARSRAPDSDLVSALPGRLLGEWKLIRPRESRGSRRRDPTLQSWTTCRCVNRALSPIRDLTRRRTRRRTRCRRRAPQNRWAYYRNCDKSAGFNRVVHPKLRKIKTSLKCHSKSL